MELTGKVKGQFNRTVAVILSENDENESSESKDRMRKVVLTELNSLRRWVEEVIGETSGNAGKKPPD